MIHVLLPILLATTSAGVLRTVEKGVEPWQKIEVIQDSKTKFPEAKYLPSTVHQTFKKFGGGVVPAFGTDSPDHSLSLLHYAKKPKSQIHKTPVLLIHGVGTDAHLTYHAVNIDGSEGLAPYLVEKGYRVFGLSFAASHGDNISHAVHIGHAIERIREVTGAKKIDLVAHSMGGLATRAFITRLDKKIPKYNNDIRRLIFVATPHAGLDLTFRHPVSYLWFSAYGFPSPWTMRDNKDVRNVSIFGPAFAGHQQMLAPLTGTHPLSDQEEHVRETYYGKNYPGTTCPGIRSAVRLGGRFMRKLNKKSLPKSIEVYMVAGTNNMLRYYDKQGKVKTQLGEYDAPSDGLIFVSSAFGEKILTKKKANVKKRLKLPKTHFELAYSKPFKRTIDSWLSIP